MITDPSHRHDTITAAALAVLVGLAGVGALLNALLDATGHPLFTAAGRNGAWGGPSGAGAPRRRRRPACRGRVAGEAHAPPLRSD